MFTKGRVASRNKFQTSHAFHTGGWRGAGGGTKVAEAVRGAGCRTTTRLRGALWRAGPEDRSGELGDRAQERKSQGYRGLRMGALWDLDQATRHGKHKSKESFTGGALKANYYRMLPVLAPGVTAGLWWGKDRRQVRGLPFRSVVIQIKPTGINCVVMEMEPRKTTDD
ncbi:hypothetical protein EYF80_015786 [Liparis tanakae]|uniref:Uncharacterized protein n=1 Tax=Liparis tanakae TaxID=230148 RepID=A0A4Z2I979_9TELE|nr:hypothetical protein EYF80_015786 [Liparis tanakae]